MADGSQTERSAYAKLVWRDGTGAQFVNYVTELPAQLCRVSTGAPAADGEHRLLIPLADQKVSRDHAVIRAEGTSLVMDVRGKNGVVIDGVSYKPDSKNATNIVLRSQSAIRIGNIKMYILLPRTSAKPTAAYVDLAREAAREAGKYMTIADLCDAIANKYPYFKSTKEASQRLKKGVRFAVDSSSEFAKVKRGEGKTAGVLFALQSIARLDDGGDDDEEPVVHTRAVKRHRGPAEPDVDKDVEEDDLVDVD